jgi:hypothetical protein
MGTSRGRKSGRKRKGVAWHEQRLTAELRLRLDCIARQTSAAKQVDRLLTWLDERKRIFPIGGAVGKLRSLDLLIQRARTFCDERDGVWISVDDVVEAVESPFPDSGRRRSGIGDIAEQQGTY